MKHPTRRRTIGLLAALVTLAGMVTAGSASRTAAVSRVHAAPRAPAVTLVPDPERTSQDETGWGWHRNVTATTVRNFLAKGYRIVDLELRSSSPRFDVAYVKNSGTYQRAWWWYHGLTGAQVKSKLSAKHARLIDIEPYSTGKGTRYAVVMVKNSGAAEKAWGWHYNVPLSTIADYVDDHNMRVVDVERNPGGTRFSALYVKNTGVDASGWWHYYNLTVDQLKQKMSDHGARPINRERRSNGRYDVVLKKTAGEYWWWRIGATSAQVSHDADRFGARVFQLKGYTSNGSTRYDALYISNTTAETRRVYAAASGIKGDWGFYVKRVGGSQVLGIGEDNVFEPASMIKVVHAVTAMRDIQNTATSTGTNITWYARPTDPARYPADFDYSDDKNKCAYDNNGKLQVSQSYVDDLGPVIIKQMMQQSDNRATDALTRRYGFNGLKATIGLAGMTSSAVNHRIGCGVKASPQPRTNNALTLRDAGRIYEGVQNTTLLNATNRDQLYAYMSGGPIGAGALRTMIEQEAMSAGLSAAEIDDFVDRVATRSKGGSYSSCPNFDGSGACDPNTRLSRTAGGVIWLPFKSGPTVTDRAYVYGRYFNVTTSCTFASVRADTCVQLNTNNAAMSTVAVEMFRAEVKRALATW